MSDLLDASSHDSKDGGDKEISIMDSDGSNPAAISFDTDFDLSATTDGLSDFVPTDDTEDQVSVSPGPSSSNAQPQPGPFSSSSSNAQQQPRSSSRKAQKQRRQRTGEVSYPTKAERRRKAQKKSESSSDEAEVDIEGLSEEDLAGLLNMQNQGAGTPEVEGTSNEEIQDYKPFALNLIENLKLLLEADRWTLDIIGHATVRLVHLNQSNNAAVAASIFWECRNSFHGIFVNNQSVHKDHPIFLSRAIPVCDNIGSVADYLSFIAKQITASTVCSGTTEHPELWNFFQGYIDKSSSPECYRSRKCSLLITEKKKICSECQFDVAKFKRELKRREGATNLSSHVRDEFLTPDELKAKKDNYRDLYKQEKKRGDRLQKRVDKLELLLDEALSDDLLSVLKANEHKMTDIQRIFWESQKQALLVKDKRGLRWHPMMIRIALRLHSFSDGALQFLNDSQIMVLPSSRRLYDYSHFVEAKEGCQEEIISIIREKILKNGPEDHYSYVNVMFDEMHIRSGIVSKKSTGELIGYTNLSEVDEELAKLQSDMLQKTYKPNLAKKILVYLVQNLTGDVKEVAAIYSTDDLSAYQLYDKTWEVVYCLEEAGIKVLTLTCDGAAINRKFFKMHQCSDNFSEEIYVTRNLASGEDRPIFFIIDPPHLMKTIRNALANSFRHKKTRKLWKNGEFLSWHILEQVYELTKNDKFKTHKLTKGHINLTSFSVMTVFLATQLLSNSVAQTIEDLVAIGKLEGLDTAELVKFIRHMNRFFDCVNGKEEEGKDVKNPDLASYTNPEDPRLDYLLNSFLAYFEDWKEDVKNRPGIFSNAQRGRMIISFQALEALQITVKSINGAIKYMLSTVKAPRINARIFNQDPLEQYFGKMRRAQGDNRNPTLKGSKDIVLNLLAQGHASMPAQQGNTQVEKKKGLAVDSTPLPVRKKPRKE